MNYNDDKEENQIEKQGTESEETFHSSYEPILKCKFEKAERQAIYKAISKVESITRIPKQIKIESVDGIFFNDIIDYEFEIFRFRSLSKLDVIHKISNRICRLRQINMEVGSQDTEPKKEYELEFLAKDSLPKTIVFDGADFATQNAFKKKLANKAPEIMFLMDDGEFTEILEQVLANDVPIVTIFNELGYNKEYNLWVCSDGILDITNGLFGYLNDKTGEIEFSDGRRYIVRVRSHKTFLPKFNKDEAISEAKSFFKNLVESEDEPAILLSFGIVLATVYIDIFFERTRGFPSVFLHGNAQVGKSTWQRIWSYIFGFKNAKNIKSGATTKFAIRKALTRLNNIPAQFDELNKNKIDMVAEIAKDSYSQVPRERGTVSGNIEQMEVKTTFVMSSNFFFEDTSESIITRFIFCSLSQKNPKLSNFKYFEPEMQERLAVILPLFIFFRPAIYSIYRQELKEISQTINSGQRYAHNIAIALSVWNIIFRLVGEELFDKNKLVQDYLEFYTPYLNMDIPFGDTILDHLGNMIVKNHVNYNDVYMLTRQNSVRLNLAKFLSAYNILHPNHPMSRNQLVMGLRSDSRFKLETSPIKKVGRAIYVDVSEHDEILELIHKQRSRRDFNE